jgi:hypothetical protein
LIRWPGLLVFVAQSHVGVPTFKVIYQYTVQYYANYP